MNYKVVFLDIDGTILMPDHTYSPSTKDAIDQLKKQGIEVFIATGRPLHEVKWLGDELNISSYIGYNGALALYRNETIVNEPMNRSLVENFVRIAKEHDHEIILFSNEKNYVTTLDRPVMQTFIDTFQLKNNEWLTEDVLDQILSISVINCKQEDRVHYQIDENLRLSDINVHGIKDSFDVIRVHVNKGEAVKKVLQRLNIKTEECIAFGDGMNDKEMLQTAGEGFAMGNSHPNLIPYAKHLTTNVTDSGIYNGLKTLGLVK
ncbi:Cof-type HAD-IIB family hydrolase [Niallia sp. Krafla_26]|uniref:Cof-type HAD-IIB family hydrolase n=1 Tax=Niallia sp. Krafla_26 TaxID=3064703 RepID=UPI003D185722